MSRLCNMAAARSQQDAVLEALTRKHDFVCVPPDGVLTEEIVLAVGDVIGVEHVRAASCMNQKVVDSWCSFPMSVLFTMS